MEDVQFMAEATEDISRLKQTLRTIQEVISEGILQVDDESIELLAADPAMVGLMNVKFKYAAFEEYESGEEFMAGINLEHLYKIVREATNDDKVVLKYGENEEGTAKWQVDIVTENFETTTVIPVLNLSEDDIPTVGDLDHQTEFKVDNKVFKRVIVDMMSLGDSFTFKATKGNLHMVTETDHYTRDLDMDVETTTWNEEDIDDNYVKSMFSKDYFKNALEGNRLCAAAGDNKFLVKMGTDFPVSLGFEDGEISFEYVIAPRIEEE